MAEEKSVNLLSLKIMPLSSKKMLKGAFPIKDTEYKHLTNWLKTVAWLSQQEKKSKTHLASYNDTILAYITVSVGILDQKIEGIPNTTSFNPQILIIGKLYVEPDARKNGIGYKLLSFVLDIAVNLENMVGCLGIIVDSNSNVTTVNFYKKFGFIEIDKNKDTHRTVRLFFQLPAKTSL